MNDVAILLDDRFEKSVPKERLEEILGKIADFARDYTQYKNQKDRLLKYGMDKVEGGTKLGEVWKFKVSKGERVLFVKGKDIKWDSYEYQNALVFLAFCDHDAQIRRARSLSIVGKTRDWTIDEFAQEVARELEYEPEECITRVFKHIDITTLVHSENLTGIYYLNREQRHFVNQDLRPLMLFGSAGSGKTTIGIYKIFALLSQHPDLKIGYFTYSNYLLSTARKIYDTVVANEIPSREADRDVMAELLDEYIKEEPVTFYNIREFLQTETHTSKMVELDQFRVFYRSLLAQASYKKFAAKVDAFDAWKEIRGMIKGFAGMGWEPNLEAGSEGLLSHQVYQSLKESYTSFPQEDRKILHEITIKYMNWLEAEGLYDENDLCRKLLIGSHDLPQYDWIVIDEVQDLTELEIYLLHKMVKDKKNILISGDFYQTITPTYFDTRRISTLLEITGEKYDQYPRLTMNYRNPEVIVATANELASYRQKLFGKDGRNDQLPEKPMVHRQGTIYVLGNNEEEKMKLLRTAIEKAYAYIVVPSETEKQHLMERLGVESRIFTISEIKGIENEYIICVNMFSAYKEKWQTIKETQRLKESHFYKYLLNMIYVAITRARNYICFVDEAIPMDLYDLFLGRKMLCDTFDPVVFHFEKASTQEDFYKYAYKLEEMENYEAALTEYEALDLEEAKIGIIRCQGALLKKEGDYEKAGELYESIAAYEEAIRCYERGGNKAKYFELLLLHDPKVFVKEVLMKTETTYAIDIKPYLTHPGLREKLEQLCLPLLGLKIGQIGEYKHFEIEETQKLISKMDNFNQRMEAMEGERQTNGVRDPEDQRK